MVDTDHQFMNDIPTNVGAVRNCCILCVSFVAKYIHINPALYANINNMHTSILNIIITGNCLYIHLHHVKNKILTFRSDVYLDNVDVQFGPRAEFIEWVLDRKLKYFPPNNI
ncbi:hypothetical protein MAR_017350 [Mya arenaria]|uniref:Uncharacterized protein n=1 Tax=Mya arenaria TaxID=6604 RepID=A0ABY7EF12_MYAAR|nr:hypothetical protein MAR_017350 [Mya arenaria]